MNKWVKLIVCIFICQLAGIIGSIFTVSSISVWYAELEKPFFSPPNWIFAPVWLTLYTLMGLSLYLILNEKNTKTALILFSTQLLLNAFWSILFFGFKNTFFALLEIIFLWIILLLTTINFYKTSKKAGLLLTPYILWVSFAIILNYFIWILNV